MNIQSFQQEIIDGLNKSDYLGVLEKCIQALEYADNLSVEEKETPEIQQIIWLAYIAQSQAQWQRGYFGLAEKPALMSLEIAKQNPKMMIQNARSLANLGIIYKEQAQYDKAYECYLQSLHVAQELQNKDLEAKILGNIANVLVRKGDNVKAIEYFELSTNIFNELGDNKSIALNIFNIAGIYKDAGDYTTALEKVQEVLEISEQSKDMYLAAYSHFHLAGINRALEKHTYALEHVRKGQSYNEILQNISLECILLDTEGSIYVNMQKYDEAIQCYKQALSLYSEDSKKDHIAHVCIHIGMLYSQLDDFASAEFHLKKGLSIFEEIGEKNSLYRAKISLAELYLTQKNHPDIFHQAKNLVLPILQEIEHDDLYDLLYNIYELLHKFYAELHQFDEAYKYAQLLIATDRKLRSLQAEKTLQQSTVRYLEEERRLLVEKNEQIFRQQQELQHQAEEIRSQYQELQDVNKRLEELSRFKEFVMATIVHDLKNPLNSILHTASLHQDNEDIASIYRAGKDMLLLVHNILEVQKFDDAAIELQIEECFVSELLHHAVQQVQEFATERHIQINVEYSTKVCYGSGQYIERTLVNLLTNAIKYSPPTGKVLVRCYSLGKEIVFSVQDWGKGIAPEYLDTIFNVYTQANKGKNVGVTFSTGIGLSFAKMAVEAHQGRIWAESELGKGSVFYFTIPSDNIDNHSELSQSYIGILHPSSTQISAADKAIIAEIYAQWQQKKIPFYSYSDILDLLDGFRYSSVALQEWRKSLENLLFTADEQKIVSYIKKYISEESDLH